MAGVHAAIAGTLAQPTGFVGIQIARPNSTVSNTGWTAVSAASLEAAINEVVTSDTSYINAGGSSSSTATFALGALAAPAPGAPHVVSLRAARNPAIPVAITATLLQGSTTIAAQAFSPANATAQPFSMTLTAPQTATITDYSALWLKFDANAFGGRVMQAFLTVGS